MKTTATLLSVAVLVPLHVARAAMRLSVSMLSKRDELTGKAYASSFPESA